MTFTIPAEFFGMYLVANALALATLATAFWSRTTARWIAVALFAWAAVVNTRTAWANPGVYVEYAALAMSTTYRDFILGWFSAHVAWLVLPIAAGQLTIAALLASRNVTRRRVGAAGAIVFLLAIAPLGVGSGFPFSLVFSAALLVVLEADEIRSRSWQRVIRFAPVVAGLCLTALLGAFASDVFGDGASMTATVLAFVVHLLPAAIVLAVVIVGWRRPRLAGALCCALAVGYSYAAAGRVSWMLVISAPLIVEGALFLWSSRFHGRAHA